MPYIGEIRLFAGQFEPRGWLFCDGRLLSIAQFSSLYALLSNIYGGNGTSNFGLPDLQGRAAIHAGYLTGNSYVPGQKLGSEETILLSNQLPSHVHKISGSVYQPVLGENPGQLLSPDNANMAITAGQQVYSTSKFGTFRMGPLKTTIQLQNTGSGQAFENMQPFLALNYIISYQGDFPSRP
ncbi:phage tail protein [Chitinophaga sp. G-6-1-13]|uniref:Phage tail protein n=1 Tax=Chitinophaga fulva TaxID=2728842 RepID=A0A848GT74_9BACT|nr:tail fiber protein [Chitinophaga fulva]NML39933.1 phage tail protein [Chitinophaga fulva]